MQNQQQNPQQQNPEVIAKQFVQHYYTNFESNRTKLATLYQDHSMLTFEGDKFQGRNNIMKKLTNLNIQSIKHQVTSFDVQPTVGNGLIVFVCGNLAVDQNQNALKFAEVFTLQPIPNQPGGYYVLNDVFRLNYC